MRLVRVGYLSRDQFYVVSTLQQINRELQKAVSLLWEHIVEQRLANFYGCKVPLHVSKYNKGVALRLQSTTYKPQRQTGSKKQGPEIERKRTRIWKNVRTLCVPSTSGGRFGNSGRELGSFLNDLTAQTISTEIHLPHCHNNFNSLLKFLITILTII